MARLGSFTVILRAEGIDKGNQNARERKVWIGAMKETGL